MRIIAALLMTGLALCAQDKVDFTKQIAPILVQRCIECHGPEEQEGDLRLDAKAHVFAAGDEDFWTVLPKDSGDSELLRRLGLGLDDEELMPARGEPLSKAQQELFRRWIDEGAEWPSAGDEFIAAELAAQVLPKITFELPEVSDGQRAAIAAAIEKLRATGGVVQRIAADTEAVEVNLSLLRDQVGDDALQSLSTLAPVLVWLNVGRTGITDAAGPHLAKLTQLRRLNLSGTKVGDGVAAALGGLTQLHYLNVYGTQVGDQGLGSLAALPSLKQLYLWQSQVTQGGVAAQKAALEGVQVDLGDYVEARLAAARQEIVDREARNKPINDKCPVSDAAVDPKFFVVHEGRRVAFCCGKCKAKFEKEPAKFAAKLPSAAPVNDKCPVSGAAVDAAHFVVHEGRRVAFCCGKCKAKFEKDPAKFAAKLPPK
ncbi:MAG: c-type cytochrome domain-containing protein [Planctomycetota bacterium]|nr:c-type cytochrome domain-containing protein [Planctomycetota bacterium]